MAAAEANPPPPARPACQRLALPVGAMLKPPSSPKPRCLQATAPRIDGSVCPMRCAQGGPGLGSEGWPCQRPHTSPAAGWALVTDKPRRVRPQAVAMPYLQPPGPAEQHPRGAGAPLRCCHARQRPWGWCCPSWGVPGLGRGEAGGCWCSRLGLTHTLPATGFNQIVILVLFYCCYKPRFL